MSNTLKFARGRIEFAGALLAAVIVGLAVAWVAPSLSSHTRDVAVSDSSAVWAHPALASATFDMCGRGARENCVIDGDTFYFHGDKIRIADIDAPETHPSRCPREEDLGDRATGELLTLLNAGPFALDNGGDGRDTDVYGRKLRVVTRGGASLGQTLISQGLAHPWVGHKLPWC